MFFQPATGTTKTLQFNSLQPILAFRSLGVRRLTEIDMDRLLSMFTSGANFYWFSETMWKHYYDQNAWENPIWNSKIINNSGNGSHRVTEAARYDEWILQHRTISARLSVMQAPFSMFSEILKNTVTLTLHVTIVLPSFTRWSNQIVLSLCGPYSLGSCFELTKACNPELRKQHTCRESLQSTAGGRLVLNFGLQRWTDRAKTTAPWKQWLFKNKKRNLLLE